jgi:hypothetical protein
MLKYVGHTGDQKAVIFFYDQFFPSDKKDEINKKLSKYKYNANVSGTNQQKENKSIVLHLESPIDECSSCINDFKEYYLSILEDIKKE